MKERPITRRSRWNTWCLYGPSGGGKTTLCATAPKPIFADSNEGLLSIAERPGLEHVRAVEVRTFSDLDKVYDNCSGTGKVNWAKRYNTLVFDHFDDIQALILDELGERRMERDDRSDPDEIQQREYGIMGNKLRRYLRKFKAIPMHKILICGEKENREDGRLTPSLIGALGHQLPYFCDHIAYLRIGKKGVRYLHLDPGDYFYAKTRANWLAPAQRKIRVPFDDVTTLSTLFALIAAGPKKGTTTDRSETTEA